MTAVDIPETLDELLSPAWLTAALAPRFPGLRVTAATLGLIVERLSTNACFHIEGDLPADLSSSLCAKGYFSEQGRPIAQVGEPEASFYRDLAGPTGVRTLRSVWAGVDSQTHAGVVITEDVIAAGGSFRDALSPCSVDDTALVLDELARLHGYAWDRDLSQVGWLAPRVGRTLGARGVPEITNNFDGAPGVDVPEAVRDPEQLVEAFRTLAGREPGAGRTVIHGDMHVGNTFLDADGRPSLVDWQLVQLGHWSIDVAYHIGSALEPAERAGNEQALLQHYLDRLASFGVDPPRFDHAWADYRRAVPYGFFLWGITQYVAQDIITVLLRRLGTAAFELESFQLLRDA